MGRLVPLLALAAAWPGRSIAANKAAEKPSKVTTTFELTIESVQSIGSPGGDVIVTHFDPNFILSGTVTWVERADVIPLNSQQSFAIHSPARLLLIDWKPGDRRCYSLTRTRSEGRTSWSLSPAFGDHACKTHGVKTNKRKGS
jgi:hypothetical protein